MTYETEHEELKRLREQSETDQCELRIRRATMQRFPFCPDHRDKVAGLSCRQCRIEELERITARIKENAIEIAPDYPGVAECEPWEQLWAIKAAYEGTDAACNDLHKIIDELRSRLGMSPEELADLSKEICYGK